MMGPGPWNGQEHALPPAAEDDFHQFLGMVDVGNMGDGLPFDFHDFGVGVGVGHENSMLHFEANHQGSLDVPMGGTDAPMAVSRHGLGIQTHLPTMNAAREVSQTLPSHHTADDDRLSQVNAQIRALCNHRLQLQHRQLEEQQRNFERQQAAFFAQAHHMVPPTPQSLEMQAANQYYAHRGDQTPQHSTGMFDHYRPAKEQHDMAFTPLVSPAVTPLDAQFPVVEARYTAPGAYFSPLTSPALHAQTESISSFDLSHHGPQMDSSPADMDLEPTATPATSIDLTKKVRKNNVTKARKTNVRQSPITRPQRRKTASTPVMNAQALSEVAEAVERLEAPAKPATASVTSADGSENASVSPEALSDMPPPPLPKPKSAKPSPYIQPHNHSTAASHALPASLDGKPSPATPASLFRISPKGQAGDAADSGGLATEQIDNFELPAPASFPTSQMPPSGKETDSRSPPEVESQKTTAVPPLPSPVFPGASQQGSSRESPRILPKLAIPNSKKTPHLAPRPVRKRASVSSVHVSPALLPKISPNIKPLLPGTPGMGAEDSASRLLASKSNYQNILEGNTVPGVSYPSELSTNLTSKRTSHKLAEQGRRNRINMALQEMATLLPKNAQKAISDEAESSGDGKGDKKDKQLGGPNSKASTVEKAIEYIKQLEQELTDAKKVAEEAKEKLRAATAQ